MANLKFIEQGDPVNTPRDNVDLPAGRWALLALVIEGVTDTGQTLDPTEVGDFRLERNGNEKHNSDLGFYFQYSDLKGGHPTAVTPTAGATRVVYWIPFGIGANTMDVKDSEEVDVFLSFANILATRFGANAVTWELWGIEAKNVPESYGLRVSRQDIQASGAVRKPEAFNQRNIAGVYLRDESDVVDSVQLIIDGDTVVDNADDDIIRDYANIVNNVESAQSLAEILVVENNIREAKNDISKFEASFNQAGTLEVRILSIEFDSVGRERSQRAVEALANASISKIAKETGQALRGIPANAVRR